MTTLTQNKGDEVASDFKSKFMSSAELMHDQLGPALCLAKWKQVSLHLATGMTNSCYHPPLHKIDLSEITDNASALHNTSYKKQQRKIMLKQERPAECQYCWNMEDLGQLSDRHYRSGESWAASDFDRIVNSTGDEDAVPSYVEVNFSNGCNLKCSYCSPQFSTAWQEEIERHGGYPTAITHNAPEHFQGDRRPIPYREYNPYLEAFWRWWPELYPQLEHFRMTGGEPLMDKNTYRVFDYIRNHPNPKLHLNVTSNFSVVDALWQKYLYQVNELCNDKTLEHFMQYVSVDAWGSRAEYIRNGLDFDLMWSRVDQFLTTIPHRNSVTFIITMNNLSVTSLQDLLAGILQLRKTHSTSYQRVWFDTPILRQPVWQSLHTLPPSYVPLLERCVEFMSNNLETEQTRFHGFKDYEVQRLARDLAWMKESMGQDVNQHRADFWRFFSEHDRRRGTDFLSVFPEMRAWWAQCQQAAHG